MEPRSVHGLYALYDPLGSGAAAAVHLGVARGKKARAVAIKRLHASRAREIGAISRLLDEVRLSRLVVHPNVVRVVDFVSDGEEMLAVMEYVHGEPLSRLLDDARKAGARVPPAVAFAIARDVLRGLNAAHDAHDGSGKSLGLVHRDVTPDNVLVGADGVARLTDFGVAKAEGRLHATVDGGVCGKLAYLAPEQIGGEVTRRTDVYAAGLVLWEMLVAERPIQGDNEAAVVAQALDPKIEVPSKRGATVSAEVDALVMRALAKNAEDRWATAGELADALEKAAAPLATSAEIAAWVRSLASARLDERQERIDEALRGETSSMAVPVEAAAVAPPEPSARLRMYVPLAVLGSLAGVACAVLLVRGLREPAPTIATPTAIAASSSTPITTATATATATATPTATATAITTPTPTAIAPAAADPSIELPATAVAVDVGHSDPARAQTRGQSTPTRARGTSRPANKCDPPWLIDSQGIRRYNPDCVQ